MRVQFIELSTGKVVKVFRQTTETDQYFIDEYEKAKKKLMKKIDFITKFKMVLLDNNGDRIK